MAASFAFQVQTLDPSGVFPPDAYLVSIAFTGDPGDYLLLGSDATTSVDAAPSGNFYKTWTWDAAHLPFTSNPFTATSVYVVTITTSTIPAVIGDSLAAATATITGDGFIIGTVGSASNAAPVGSVISQNPIADTPASPGDAVNLVLSTGPIPSLIFKLTQKLLLNLHRVFDKDPYQQLALRLQYDGSAMTWRIANGVLTTTITGGSGSNQSIALSNLTIATLADFLAGLPGYSVPFQDASSYADLSALVLIDGTNNLDTSNGDHIYGYTTLLWAYLEASGSELGAAQAQIPEMLDQMAIPTADNEWVDEHGSYYDVPRNQGELDSAYGPRIISQVLQPRGNNVAIAMAIQANAPLATRVRVIDSINDPFSIIYNGLINFNGLALFDAGGGGSLHGFFDVDFSYDFSTDVIGQTAYIAIIENTVETFRDAGTELRLIIFRNLNSTTLIISDSFVGNVRVIVYNDFSGLNFRLLENGQVRLLESGDARLLE